MASGIRHAGDRPKRPKHLRAKGEKKFRNLSPDAIANYHKKLAARAARKAKRKHRKK